MPDSNDNGGDRISRRIMHRAGRARSQDAAAIERFAASFLAHIPAQDLADANPAALGDSLASLWEFARGRKRGRARVRAINPSPADHPWKAGGTIIEIVNDDMPFLLDSLRAELHRQGLTVHLDLHPVVDIAQGDPGKSSIPRPRGDGRHDSVIHFRVTEQTDRTALREVLAGLRQVLREVRSAVRDWLPMREQVVAAAAELGRHSSGVPEDEIAESKDFLRWLDNDNFTFLGYREYTVAGSGRKRRAVTAAGSGLGILRDDATPVFEGFGEAALPPNVLAASGRLPPIVVNKGDHRSRVHRAVHPDTVLVRKTDRAGRTVGQRLFVGLFTSVVYRQSIGSIPLIRRKIRGVAACSGLSLDSHDGKALAHILETLPRDELFQFDQDELHDTAMGILGLEARRSVDMFTRRDSFGRYVSCLVYLPRDRFETRLQQRVMNVLAAGFGGSVTADYVQISDDLHARMHIVIRTEPGAAFTRDVDEIKAEVVEACRAWSDDLAAELEQRHGEKAGAALFERYGDAFPAAWRDRYGASATVADIARFETVFDNGGIALDLLRLPGDADDRVHFKVFIREDALPLSDALPLLENMGFRVIDENPHKVVTNQGRTAWMHDFGMVASDGADIDIDALRDPFAEGFTQVWRNEVENDGFNALILSAGLHWRQVVVVRALCRYLRQTGMPFSESYMVETLIRNSGVTRNLVALFETMFEPGIPHRTRDRRSRELNNAVDEALDAIANPDEDRILRRLSNLIDCTLRTNFFVSGPDGGPLQRLSFKFDSMWIVDLPLPKPAREIFVYSPRVEGVHCRGGLIARGGLRWSDRREDFRTEILGLMKAQMTKNAVIVPEGAKGGFIVKQPPRDGGREALIAEGIACYKTYVRSLLDITDNLVAGKTVPPGNVVRRDGDDPYLVVAADKGTATFSDIANGVAAEYGFWLGDAFASGGSAGYDHKKMGITARGAWECVKRHFREIGLDTQSEDFTVVGVGDMSGDVFGNGMLQSRHIKLVGAFNHIHIFIDPDPDPAAAWKERNRLFRKPRSSWTDYDEKLISRGGGVFDRNAKEIDLAPEARKLFDLPEQGKVTPAQLILAMLQARVGLLWFGGIGTYVKASTESHMDVGDRANDAVRTDGRNLRCKVVGEGANLGVTQRGRIEYALGGGRINADFIDNSAGVASSDQEVNIKILLGEVMAAGGLDLPDRDQMLADMTDDVARHALMDNYRQSMALSHAEARATQTLDEHARFIRALERTGELDRAVECLPEDEEIAERAAHRQGLTRPEIAILLAYAKMALFKNLLASDVPDDPGLVRDIGLYFPPMLRKRYGERMPGHRLQRQITATYLANSLTNRVGPTFVETITMEKGVAPDRIVRAYLVCREVFGLPDLWNGIEELDNRIEAEVQTALHLAVLDLIGRATVWFATSAGESLDMATVEAFRPGIAALSAELERHMSKAMCMRTEQSAAQYAADGVPAKLARGVAQLDILYSGCDIVRIARDSDEPVGDAAQAYFQVGERFGFDSLREIADAIIPENEWQSAASAAIVDNLHNHQAKLTGVLIGAAGAAASLTGALGQWEQHRTHQVSRLRQVLGDIERSGSADLAMLSVAESHIRSLCAA